MQYETCPISERRHIDRVRARAAELQKHQHAMRGQLLFCASRRLLICVLAAVKV